LTFSTRKRYVLATQRDIWLAAAAAALKCLPYAQHSQNYIRICTVAVPACHRVHILTAAAHYRVLTAHTVLWRLVRFLSSQTPACWLKAAAVHDHL
jgi:hypothetical protein